MHARHWIVNARRRTAPALISGLGGLGGLVLVAAACGSNSNYGGRSTATTAPTGAAPVSAAVSATAAVQVTATATTAAATGAASPASNAPPATAQVDIKGIAFSGPVTIRPGGSVTWTNKDGFAHTVTADPGQAVNFDSKDVQPGATFSMTFAQAGTYAYHCNIHASMHGTVVVSTGAATPPTSPTPKASATSTAPDYKY